MRNEINEMDEFDVLLNEVLRDVANMEPENGLRDKVMMRMLVETDGREPEPVVLRPAFVFEAGLRQEGVFRSLWDGLRELLFPAKLPPLVLESRPIAVVDRMAAGRSYGSTAWAVVAHALVILLIVGLLAKHVGFTAPVKMVEVTDLSVPPMAVAKAQAMGGGGGQRGPTPVTKGTPPKFADQQIVAPKAPPLVAPKIHIEPTIEVQKDVRMESSIPQIGVWRVRRWLGCPWGMVRGRGWVRVVEVALGWARGEIRAAGRHGLAAA